MEVQHVLNAQVLRVTCQLKEGENPDGVYTADGTQTSCVNIQYYNDPDDPSDDDDYYSQDPCETEAAKQAALAEAAKTCEITNNCKVIPGQEEYGGCILDHGPGSPGFFNTDGEEENVLYYRYRPFE